MMRALPASLVVRIVVLQLVTLAVVGAGLLVAIRVQINAVFVGFERQVLHDHATTIARAVTPGLDLHLPDGLADLYAHDSGGFAYAVFDARGRRIASSRQGGPIAPEPPVLGAQPSYVQRVSYVGAVFPERVGNQGYWVQVVQSLAHPDVYADDIVRVFVARIGWFVFPIAFALLAVNGLIVHHALRPVVTASRRAGAIHPHRIDVRLPELGLPIEIVPLVRAVNHALDRLADGFRRQREFTADVAHELRTPLAVLRLRAETIGDPTLAAAFRADIDAMSRLTDQLLALAELETFTLRDGERADLVAIAASIAGLLAPAGLHMGVEIELVAPDTPVWVHGQVDPIARALRNLVENALTVSPDGATVTIAVDTQGTIRVADRGPGIAEADCQRIFRRGWRRDRDGPGHGLGLNIVQRIVEAHGAAITVETPAGGGAVFEICFARFGETDDGPFAKDPPSIHR